MKTASRCALGYGRRATFMPLYAATIFFSAFLLFLLQPIMAKQILPWFGGSAAVWTTCLVFFQTTRQVVHTAADPPNHGRICLAMIGCNRKSRNALKKIVAA